MPLAHGGSVSAPAEPCATPPPPVRGSRDVVVSKAVARRWQWPLVATQYERQAGAGDCAECARACGRARAAAAHLLHLRRLVVHAAWWCAVGERPPLPCTPGRVCPLARAPPSRSVSWLSSKLRRERRVCTQPRPRGCGSQLRASPPGSAGRETPPLAAAGGCGRPGAAATRAMLSAGSGGAGQGNAHMPGPRSTGRVRRAQSRTIPSSSRREGADGLHSGPTT